MIEAKKIIRYDEVLKDKGKYITLFSEGNTALASLLDCCFDNNIETRGCCKGHSDKKNSYPLIAFAINSTNKNYILKLIANLNPVNNTFIFDYHSDIKGPIFIVQNMVYNNQSFFEEIEMILKNECGIKVNPYFDKLFALFNEQTHFKDINLLKIAFIHDANGKNTDVLLTTDHAGIKEQAKKLKIKVLVKHLHQVTYKIVAESDLTKLINFIKNNE